MEFIELVPSRAPKSPASKVRNKVRISFPQKKNKDMKVIGHNLIIFIGSDICNKLGLKIRDKVTFLYGANDNKTWQIKPYYEGALNSYTLTASSNTIKNPSSLRIQLTFELYDPSSNKIELHEVAYKLEDNALIIYSNKS